MIVQQLVHLFAPWQSLYSNSRIVPAVTEAGHLLSMLAGGGLAVAADRTTLRLARSNAERRALHLAEVREIHRPVVVSLAVLFVTGIALAAADIETFAGSPMFWIKLALVALLLLNGFLLTRTETRLREFVAIDDKQSMKAWQAWRREAVCSVFLWSATLVAGVLLVNVA